MGDAMTRLRASYTGDWSMVEWCLRLAPAERPQSVFRLQKELREQTNALSEQAPAPAPAAPEPAPTTRLMTLLRRREDKGRPGHRASASAAAATDPRSRRLPDTRPARIANHTTDARLDAAIMNQCAGKRRQP